MGKMKSVPVVIFLLGLVYFSSATEENPTRFRRLYNDKEILKVRKNNFGEKVGTPLVFNREKKAFIRTGVSETREEMEDGMAGKSAKEMSDDEENTGPGLSESENGLGDNGSEGDNNRENMEKMGSGYDNISDMGSSDGEDDERGSDGSGGSAADEPPPDFSGEFPPSADQVAKLPKEDDMTDEEIDRKMTDQRKGYVRFTIRQPFKPQYKYKESAAYKILAGNVRQDVERALQATGVVKDVLFREARNIGGPPYHSKVEVFLKLENMRPNKLKKIIDHGLINGMISVPGSFHL